MPDQDAVKDTEKQYERPRITDHGTLTEFTAGMHAGHALDSSFNNHDGEDRPHSVPS
jgi:hypothetical protein